MAIEQEQSFELPRFISVDDHLVEPHGLWQDRLPSKFKEQGPRVQRQKGQVVYSPAGQPGFATTDGPEARWCDVWFYEDTAWPMHAAFAAVGPTALLPATTALTYDDLLPGCFDQTQRLADMDANHTEASLCFPTVPRFCGQLFLNRQDMDLAHLCVRAYNDFMIDEWCGGAGAGRLIPLDARPPLGSRHLRPQRSAGAPTWARMRWRSPRAPRSSVCRASTPESGSRSLPRARRPNTVINMHIGSSSKQSQTSPGAPMIAMVALTSENSVHALVDWLLCGALARYPSLKIALSESQVGWMPFILERLDSAWRRSKNYDPSIYERIPEPPSSYVPDRVFACVFDDSVGLVLRDHVGMSQIMFETDYPHADSTFPESKLVAEKMIAEAGLSTSEAHQFLRTNAIACYDLRQFGIE